MTFFELYRGVISGLLGALFFGAGSAVYKLVGEEIDVVSMNFYRAILGFLFFLAATLLIRDFSAFLLLSRDMVLLLAVSVIFNVVIGDTAYFRAQNLIGVSRAFPITNLMPLFTLFFAVFFLSEPLTYRILTGVLLVVSGVYFVAQPPKQELVDPLQTVQMPIPETRTRTIGFSLAFLTALCWAGGTLTLRLVFSDELGVISTNSIRFAFAVFFLWLMGSWQGSSSSTVRKLRTYRRQTLKVVVIATILNIMLGSLFWVDSVKYAGASKSATFVATSPLFALPIAMKFGAEAISWKILLGTIMTVIGVYLVI